MLLEARERERNRQMAVPQPRVNYQAVNVVEQAWGAVPIQVQPQQARAAHHDELNWMHDQ
ncbi:hypothetical protein H0H93_004779, partial [Arthromyces matolae]